MTILVHGPTRSALLLENLVLLLNHRKSENKSSNTSHHPSVPKPFPFNLR